METAGSSETLIPFYKTTRRQVREYRNLSLGSKCTFFSEDKRKRGVYEEAKGQEE
jgi:hypothetical protein